MSLDNLKKMIESNKNTFYIIFFFRLAAEFPAELTAIPLDDIDPYYQNKKVYY